MQFYDLFKDIIAYIPEKYTLLQQLIDTALPFVLMGCALLTAFFGLKCAGWWCKLTFFFLGTGLGVKYLIDETGFYNFTFWLMLGISLCIGILAACFSKYLARAELVISEFCIIYAALPPLMFYFNEVPAKIVSAVTALAVAFLTVRYKYLVLLPTTAFSGSFLFWEVAVRYIDYGNETLNGMIMGTVAFAFQCYISREQLKATYEDVKKKAKTTQKEGKRAVRYVERKIHTEGVNIQPIRLKGAKNVRDLGGLPVKGGTIKPKMLLRSSHLNAITENDANRLLNEYGLKTVIDLRTGAEKDEKPNVPINGVKYFEIPVFDSSIPGLSHESKQDLDHIPEMERLYAAVMKGECLSNLCAAVQTIIAAGDERYAILYHCTEGKDRTGMVTALLLTVLGAEREVILEDYLFTNKTNRKKAIGYYLLVRIFKHNKKAANRVYNVFLAREEYINEVFKLVDSIGTERLMNDCLKLTEEELHAFVDRVVEKE